MRREWPEQSEGESPCRIHVRYAGNGQEGKRTSGKKQGDKGFPDGVKIRKKRLQNESGDEFHPCEIGRKIMSKTMKIATLILLMLACALSASAQQERKFIREGNGLFNGQDFEKAEVEYRKAIDKKALSFEAGFNLGDALYKQKKYEEALQQFSAMAKEEKDKEKLGELYHNIGNTLLAMEKTEESIEAYKESLRNRPASAETKYNLEYARHKQQQDQNKDDQNKDNQDNKDNKDNKDNQDQQDQQNKDQQDQNKDQDKDKQDQNKDQQDQNKDQQDKDKQDQNKDQNKDNKDNKDKQDQQQQQPQEQQGKISKEDAARLLEALQNDEKNVQEKVQKQKAQEQKAKKIKIEKDW